MIIKKYLANTLNDALELVKQELGPDHVILTTRQVPRKGILGWLQPSNVEVTAAVEEKDLQAFNQKKLTKQTPEPVPPMAHTTQGGLEDNLAQLKALLKQQEQVQTQSDPTPKPTVAPKLNETVSNPAAGIYGDPRLKKMPTKIVELTEPEPTPLANDAQNTLRNLKRASAALLEHFHDETPAETREPTRTPEPRIPTEEHVDAMDARQLREIIREEMQNAQKGTSVGDLRHTDEETLGSVRFLLGKGVSRRQAVAIEKTLQREFGEIDLNKPSRERSLYMNAMKQELTNRVKTTGPISLVRGKPTLVALVGPTGVGKTTTLAKIAAQYSEQLGRRVGVVSLDTQKLGAREQIQALANKFNLPMRVASNETEMLSAIDQLSDNDLILIDTAGRSQYQEGQIETLARMLEVRPDIQAHLVLSATTKDVDLYGSISQFRRLPLTALIFTKMDETIAYGMMIDLCEKSGLPVSYLTNGQRIPGDIRVADPEQVARMILTRHNSAECEKLRRLAAG